jgi:ATP-dependent Lhr-like helicase
MAELRREFPWVRSDSTALVHHSDTELRWWTFAGGMANTILAHQLKQFSDTRSNNLSVRLEGRLSPEDVREFLGSLRSDQIVAVPDPDAIENFKFSDALTEALANEVFCARFTDVEVIQTVLEKPVRHVSEGIGGSP